jgi:hypothetical protein
MSNSFHQVKLGWSFIRFSQLSLIKHSCFLYALVKLAQLAKQA